MEELPGTRTGRKRARKRRKLSPLTVIGELLLTAGLGVLGYIVWQPWHTGVTVQHQQESLAAKDSAKWQKESGAAVNLAGADPHTDNVPVVPKPAKAEVFGVLRVPAFGTTFANRVAETTDWWTVLNLDDKGIGHYEDTQLPGEPGNFVLAGHRSGPLINSFRQIMNLRIGDPLFFETAEGWYVYRFRNIEYTLPNEYDVTWPFPRFDGVPGTDQMLTLTTCHPKLAGSDERAIAYAVFEGFTSRAEGPPKELLKLNPTLSGEQAKRGDWG